MSLTILRAEWWKEKLFKKNNRKDTDEEPERSEKFNKIKARIDEIIEIQFNGGWKLTEEEQKIQDEFLPKLFKKMTGKKELPEKTQITTLIPRNESEAVEILEKINGDFPGIIENFVKSKKLSEKHKKDIETSENVSSIYQDIKRMHGDIERKHREIMEASTQTYLEGKSHNKKTSKKDSDINEKKEKMGISDVVKPFTQEDWKRQPKTLRNFLEQLRIKDVGRTLRVTNKEREENFLKALENLERYFPSYKPENKEKASDLLSKMLERPDIKKREEIQKRIKALIDRAKSK